MSKKELRGTKRTCQNAECGSRFYDLMRNPIVCPICQSAYTLTASAAAAAAAAGEEKARARAKKAEYAVEKAAPPPELAGEEVAAEAIPDIEGAEEPVVAEDDETFLAEEEGEDGADVTGIIGGPGEEGEEET